MHVAMNVGIGFIKLLLRNVILAIVVVADCWSVDSGNKSWAADTGTTHAQWLAQSSLQVLVRPDDGFTGITTESQLGSDRARVGAAGAMSRHVEPT